jgi:PBP1b-binding outer membrane lipoprotein LpoB
MKKLSAAIAALAVAAMLFTGCEAAQNKPQGTTGNTSNATTTSLTTTSHATTTTPTTTLTTTVDLATATEHTVN